MIISKSAQKVIDRADKPTQAKLNKALAKIECGEGYIEPLKNIKRGMEDDLFRYKMEHYRIIFERGEHIKIRSITTKSNTKYKTTKCF